MTTPRQLNSDFFKEAERHYLEQKAEMDKPGYNEKLEALRDGWYRRATGPTMSLETLPTFLAELASHKHDYNTCVYAIAAGAVAAAKALDRTPNLGITGFQAGAVFWEFFLTWLHKKRGAPFSLVDYEHMLYPQYATEFRKILPRKTFEWLQTRARELLNESGAAHANVKTHWQSIVEGAPPFEFLIEWDEA